MAHGICGPLALLALACSAGITVPGQLDAIATIRSWLEACRQNGPAGPWWPERLTLPEPRAGSIRQDGPARPSWCYGTPGIARALQLAALAERDLAAQAAAENALLACISDDAQLSLLDGPTLCHGWAGLVATVSAVASDALTSALADRLPALSSRLVNRLDGAHDLRSGLIDGTAGAALVLQDLSAGALTRWAGCLLITGRVPT